MTAHVLRRKRTNLHTASLRVSTQTSISKSTTDSDEQFDPDLAELTAVEQQDGGASITTDNYFGLEGRGRFFQEFQDLVEDRNRRDFENHKSLLDQTKLSPRRAYLHDMIHLQQLPLPCLIRKSLSTETINVAGRGLGNDQVLALGKHLAQVPLLMGLNLADNRLTACSLHPLLLSLPSVCSLAELNLSHNQIDLRSAEALAAYLACGSSRDSGHGHGHGSCTLRTLVCTHAGMGDNETQVGGGASIQ